MCGFDLHLLIFQQVCNQHDDVQIYVHIKTSDKIDTKTHRR